MSDSCRLLVALSVAAMIHAVALSQGFGFASVVTGDIHSRLRPLIVAQPKCWPYWAVTIAAVAIGVVLFVVDLGSVGLVDETPPLFAASARTMARTGDWLIPHVNGLPRYDKPLWCIG